MDSDRENLIDQGSVDSDSSSSPPSANSEGGSEVALSLHGSTSRARTDSQLSGPVDGAPTKKQDVARPGEPSAVTHDDSTADRPRVSSDVPIEPGAVTIEPTENRHSNTRGLPDVVTEAEEGLDKNLPNVGRSREEIIDRPLESSNAQHDSEDSGSDETELTSDDSSNSIEQSDTISPPRRRPLMDPDELYNLYNSGPPELPSGHSSSGKTPSSSRVQSEVPSVSTEARSENPPGAAEAIPEVFLHFSGQCERLPSFQPDCLKIFTWMRAVGEAWWLIPRKLDIDGRYPRVKVGDNAPIRNTYAIFDEINAQLPGLRDLDENLTPEQRQLANSLGSAVEDYLGGEHREWYQTKRGELLRAYEIDLKECWTTRWLLRSTPKCVLEYIFKMCAPRKHSLGSVLRASHSRVILSELRDQLGDNTYFFGNEVSTLDVRVFAVLKPILDISDDVTFKLRDDIRNDFGSLVRFTEHIKNEIYPDWDEWCFGGGMNLMDNSETLERRALNTPFYGSRRSSSI